LKSICCRPFEDQQLVAISRDAVAIWEKNERAAGYADSSVRSWRALLHLILADAIEEGLVVANPAAKRRGRGKRAGRLLRRGAEKAITSALGMLLIAERVALLSGRDDEFVAVMTAGFTGIRWGGTGWFGDQVCAFVRYQSRVAAVRVGQRTAAPMSTEG
jgi:hypothetical protein